MTPALTSIVATVKVDGVETEISRLRQWPVGRFRRRAGHVGFDVACWTTRSTR